MNSEAELNALQADGKLQGAFAITGDKKHVGIHRIFYVVQKICDFIEPLLAKIRGHHINIDTNLCHGMIVVGWDNDKQRPLLSHSVLNGVKVNAVNYFTYEDKDVDHMVLFVPKNAELRQEFIENAKRMAKRGDDNTPLCKFSWGHLLKSMFRRQIHKKPSGQMKKELAYALADTLLDTAVMKGSKGEETRSMFCMEFATLMLQVSILTNSLSESEKQSLLALKDRKKIAKAIKSKMDAQDDNDSLSRAYWQNRVCQEIDASSIMSAYAADIFSRYAESN